jgi:hypothetical protein
MVEGKAEHENMMSDVIKQMSFNECMMTNENTEIRILT